MTVCPGLPKKKPDCVLMVGFTGGTKGTYISTWDIYITSGAGVNGNKSMRKGT